MKREEFFGLMRLDKEIEVLQDILKDLEDYSPQTICAGKVRGSDACFPYLERSFTINTVDEEDLKRVEKEKEKILQLIDKKIAEYEKLRVDIAIFLSEVPDIQHRTILKKTLEGKTQRQIADEEYLTQSTISKVVRRYVK